MFEVFKFYLFNENESKLNFSVDYFLSFLLER